MPFTQNRVKLLRFDQELICSQIIVQRRDMSVSKEKWSTTFEWFDL